MLLIETQDSLIVFINLTINNNLSLFPETTLLLETIHEIIIVALTICEIYSWCFLGLIFFFVGPRINLPNIVLSLSNTTLNNDGEINENSNDLKKAASEISKIDSKVGSIVARGNFPSSKDLKKLDSDARDDVYMIMAKYVDPDVIANKYGVDLDEARVLGRGMSDDALDRDTRQSDSFH